MICGGAVNSPASNLEKASLLSDSGAGQVGHEPVCPKVCIGALRPELQIEWEETELLEQDAQDTMKGACSLSKRILPGALPLAVTVARLDMSG